MTEMPGYSFAQSAKDSPRTWVGAQAPSRGEVRVLSGGAGRTLVDIQRPTAELEPFTHSIQVTPS
jgi:hypothetical protein